MDSDYDLDDDDEDEDESCPSHDSFQELRDNVRECLEKDPAERCAEDISTLMVCLLALFFLFATILL